MRNIIIKRERRRASALAVNDVTFDDVMCIPQGQADGKLFTRPFLSFRYRRGWHARLMYTYHMYRIAKNFAG